MGGGSPEGGSWYSTRFANLATGYPRPQPNKFSFSESTKSRHGLGFAFFVVLAVLAGLPPLLRIGWSSNKLFLCRAGTPRILLGRTQK